MRFLGKLLSLENTGKKKGETEVQKWGSRLMKNLWVQNIYTPTPNLEIKEYIKILYTYTHSLSLYIYIWSIQKCEKIHDKTENIYVSTFIGK